MSSRLAPIFTNGGGGLERSPKPAVSQQLHGGAATPPPPTPGHRVPDPGAGIVHISSFHPWDGPGKVAAVTRLAGGEAEAPTGDEKLGRGCLAPAPRENRGVASVWRCGGPWAVSLKFFMAFAGGCPVLSFALGPAIMWRLRSREAAPHPTCVVGDGVGVVWVLGAPSPPSPRFASHKLCDLGGVA